MQTKAYFASSVPAALEVARQELGPDAMLVGSRPAPPHVRQFGRLEVTFAWTPQEKPPEAQGRALFSLAQGGARSAPVPPARASGGTELDDIRRQLRSLQSALQGGVPGPATDGPAEWLIEAGLDPTISRELADAASQLPGLLPATLFAAVTQRIHVIPFVPLRSGESRTLAFIGPPGRGKTTSLIKIAVSRALANRVPVRIFTAGAHGVGSSEQMARYASILGAPHQSFEALESLELALRGEGWKGLTLIDTPGLSVGDQADLSTFARFFSRHEEFESHLVLRAESRYADMLHVIESFSGLRPKRLLFTGMDETRDWSAMVGAMIQASIPATFAGTGRAIPEDLTEADADQLARAILPATSTGTAALAQRAAA